MTIAFFKSLTKNKRIAITRVFMPNPEVVVIKQRVLATQQDIENGWFSNFKPIKVYKDRVLVENEMVMWKESFNSVSYAVEILEK